MSISDTMPETRTLRQTRFDISRLYPLLDWGGALTIRW